MVVFTTTLIFWLAKEQMFGYNVITEKTNNIFIIIILNSGGSIVEKTFVNVDYQVFANGIVKPISIHWHDGRKWDIEKILHTCSSEGDFKGIRYTVLIGSAEKYLYRIGEEWYVEPVHQEVNTS